MAADNQASDYGRVFGMQLAGLDIYNLVAENTQLDSLPIPGTIL